MSGILPTNVYIVERIDGVVVAVYSNQHAAKAHLKAEADVGVTTYPLKDVYLGRERPDDIDRHRKSPYGPYTIRTEGLQHLGKSYQTEQLATAAARRISAAKQHPYVEIWDRTRAILRVWMDDGRVEDLR